MGFRGGVKLTPPQRILVFKYPSGDRVKNTILRDCISKFKWSFVSRVVCIYTIYIGILDIDICILDISIGILDIDICILDISIGSLDIYIGILDIFV